MHKTFEIILLKKFRLLLYYKSFIQTELTVSFIIGDSDPEHIYLTDGASKGVMQILQTIIRGQGDGVRNKIITSSFNQKFLCKCTFDYLNSCFSSSDFSSRPSVSIILGCYIRIWWLSRSILSRRDC